MALDPRVPCAIGAIRLYVLKDQDDGALDADLEREANSAIARIEQHIGGPVLARDFTETHDGTGRATLYTLARPVVSITSVTIDGAAAAGFAFNPRTGKVELTSGTFTKGTGNVVLALRAGYETANLPPDLFEAFLAYVLWIHSEKADGTLGRLNVSAGQNTISVAIKLPESIRLALAPYVDVRF